MIKGKRVSGTPDKKPRKYWSLPPAEKLSKEFSLSVTPAMGKWIKAEAGRLGFCPARYLRDLIEADQEKKKCAN